MENNELLNLVLAALDDAKGNDISVMDVRGKTDVTDFMIVVSGTSERHVKSLARQVVDKVSEHRYRPLGIEGADAGEWVLVDLGDIIVHAMKPQIREFYQLEKFWQGDYGNFATG